MKTKLLKFGMPFMAFMLAIAFAFASTSTSKAENTALALVPGYIFQNEKCEVVTTCSNIPGPLCWYADGVPATEMINETQCGAQLYHRNNG